MSDHLLGMENEKVLLIATRNLGKAREFADALQAGAWKICTLRDLPAAPEIEESGATLAENAWIKARSISERWPEAVVLADDSGLEVDALNGAPGVYSARFAGEGATDAENNRKLLKALEGRIDEERGAQFRCVLILARGGERLAQAEGICRGRILEVLRGKEGFGYDPLFVPEGAVQTFAEMDLAQKQEVSHRARALRMLAEAWVELMAVGKS